MKVLLVNGSSHPKGCTNAALEEIARSLAEEGIDSEIYFIGTKPMTDCIACHKCSELGKQNGLPHPKNEHLFTNFVR